MRLIDAIRGGTEEKVRSGGSFGPWSWPSSFSFNGNAYGAGLVQTNPGTKTEIINPDFAGFMHAIKQSPPAFAAQTKRARYLSQARFTWRNIDDRHLFGSSALRILERPWPSGTTGELLTKMEWHEGVAGNAFVYRMQTPQGPELKVLRPDWVTIVLGSDMDAEDPSHALDARVVGYLYTPGGLSSGKRPTTLLPENVAHWSPLPDPMASFRGMSWMTPAVREIQGDIATADHKLRFFENGATPNLVVKGIPATDSDDFRRVVDLMEEDHAGIANAYKTLYLAAGADATVVGANLSEIAFKEVQGAGETRIAVVGEVPASLLGISEGMQGSSLNAGNYKEARRSFIDSWLTSTLQSAAACLDHIVDSPSNAELWFDTSDMPLLREDESDAASIRQSDASTLRTLTDAGFDPDAGVEFVQTGDLESLKGKHTGLFSVQLLPPDQTSGDPDA